VAASTRENLLVTVCEGVVMALAACSGLGMHRRHRGRRPAAMAVSLRRSGGGDKKSKNQWRNALSGS